jgi:hypothetical protein
MAVGSAAIAAPLLTNVAGMVPEAQAAEKAKTAAKTYYFVDQRSCDLVVG